MTARRLSVLINQLPPGSRLGAAIGGDAAWTVQQHTDNANAHQIVSAVLLAGGAKRHQLPDAPKPPEVGWQQKEAARAAREYARAERAVERHQARPGR